MPLLGQEGAAAPFHDYADFYKRTYSAHVREVRRTRASQVSVLAIEQPAGHFPDAPLPELVLTHCLLNDHQCTIDNGAGRFDTIIRSGSWVATPPMAGMDVTVGGPHELRCIGIPVATLARGLPDPQAAFAGDYGPLHAMAFTNPHLNFLSDRLWGELQEGRPNGALLEDQIVQGLGEVLGAMAAGGASRDIRSGGLDDRRFRRVADYVDANLSDDITLDELAGAAALSRYHFVRAFRATVGLTPFTYVLRRRAEQAQWLLRSTSLPLAEIALACGFSSQAHFATAFKGRTGVSPRVFRAAMN